MKKLIRLFIPLTALLSVCLVFGFTGLSTSCENTETTTEHKHHPQHINLAVSHGHCSSKFSGQVENLNLELIPRTDLGNPLEEMKLSFDIDPKTLNACNDSSLSEKLKSPGLFLKEEGDRITFETTNTYTMGIDWYQINGVLTIKGIKHNVIWFATGIREKNETSPTELVLQGQVNLLDWEINFDKFLFGTIDSPTNWLHLSMVIDLDK